MDGTSSLTNIPSLLREEFDPPSWISHLYPKGEDCLVGDENWLSWSTTMKRLLEAADVWDIVSGKESRPPLESVADLLIWAQKDEYAKISIMQSVSKALAAALGGLSSPEMWTLLQRVYQKSIGSGSVVFWLKQLIRRAEGTYTMTQHLELFQISLRYLTNAGVTFQEHVKVAMLLATLPDDSTSTADSWARFVSEFRFNETTQLSAVITSILLEVHERETKDLNLGSTVTPMVAREHQTRMKGRKFCRNCNREGHDLADCWAMGGPKEGLRQPTRKKKERRL